MKAFHRFWFAPLLFVALALAASIASSRADDVIIRQFNDAGGLSGWRFDYGGVTNLIEFDATQDASNPKVTFIEPEAGLFDASCVASKAIKLVTPP